MKRMHAIDLGLKVATGEGMERARRIAIDCSTLFSFGPEPRVACPHSCCKRNFTGSKRFTTTRTHRGVARKQFPRPWNENMWANGGSQIGCLAMSLLVETFCTHGPWGINTLPCRLYSLVDSQVPDPKPANCKVGGIRRKWCSLLSSLLWQSLPSLRLLVRRPISVLVPARTLDACSHQTSRISYLDSTSILELKFTRPSMARKVSSLVYFMYRHSWHAC